MTHLRDQAVELAEKGYAVVPVSVSRTLEGKKVVRYPVVDDVAWSVNQASQDPSKVEGMPWDEPYTDIMMNLTRSGVLVFDLDADKLFREIDLGNGDAYDDPINGDELLYTFQEDFQLPTYMWAKSHSGDGRHVFFQAPTDLALTSSTKKLASYVDVKATGALIVGDPDKLPETYLLPSLPFEFREKLGKVTSPKEKLEATPSAPKYLKGEGGTPYGLRALEAELRSIDDEWQEDRGNFNHQLYVSARSLGELAAGGELHETSTYTRLSELLTGLSAPADQFKTLDSGFYTGLKEPRSSDTLVSEDPVEQAKVSDDRVSALRAEFKNDDEMQNLPSPEWLIEGWLVKGGLTHIIGEGKIGKTFITLDMAACLASGKAWPDHSPAEKKFKVLYIVGEGVYGFGQRVKAWNTHYDGKTGITYLARPISIMERDGRSLKQSAGWHTMATVLKEDRYDLVLLDTQQRMTVGVQENDATEMGQLVAALEEVTRETDACLALVHHVNKGETASARGSSVLAGSVNTEIKLTGNRSEGTIRVANTLQKDGPMADSLYFQLTEVPGTESVVPLLDETGSVEQALEGEDGETEQRPSTKTKASIEAEDRRIRIMNLLTMRDGDGVSFREIHAAAGGQKQRVSDTLKKLVEENKIIRRGEKLNATWSLR